MIHSNEPRVLRMGDFLSTLYFFYVHPQALLTVNMPKGCHFIKWYYNCYKSNWKNESKKPKKKELLGNIIIKFRIKLLNLFNYCF